MRCGAANRGRSRLLGGLPRWTADARRLLTPSPAERILSGSYKVIVALVLPKGLAVVAEQFIGAMGRKPFQRRQPSRSHNLGGNSAGAPVRQAIHGHKCPAGLGQAIGKEDAMRGKAAVQTKRDKQRLIDSVPVRKSPLVVSHPEGGVWTQENFSENPRGKPPERRLRP
jgi:hypothetical protein